METSFCCGFVNNVQPIREIDVKDIKQERKKRNRAAALGKLIFDNKIAIKTINDFKIKGIPVRMYRNSDRPA